MLEMMKKVNVNMQCFAKMKLYNISSNTNNANHSGSVDGEAGLW